MQLFRNDMKVKITNTKCARHAAVSQWSRKSVAATTSS